MKPLANAVLGLVLVAAGVAIGWGVRGITRPDGAGAPEEGETRTALDEMKVKVRTEVAAAGRLPLTIPVVGEIRAAPNVIHAVASRAPGRILEILVAPGAAVKRGDPVARLDPVPLELALAQAKAAMAQAVGQAEDFERSGRERQRVDLRAAVQRAQAELRFAEAQVSRLEPLVKDGLVPEKSLDESRKAVDSSRLDLESAQRSLAAFETVGAELSRRSLEAARESANAGVALAGAMVGEAVILAPADGVILTMTARPHDVIDAGASLGTLLAGPGRIAVFDVAPADIRRVVAGSAAFWKDESGAARTGSVAVVMPTVESDTGFVEVVVPLDDQGAASPIGLILRGSIAVGETADAVLVPEGAVYRAEDEQVVVVAGADGKAKVVRVRVLARHEGRAAVTGGIAAGAAVVTEGGYNIPDGAHLELEGAEAHPAESQPGGGRK